MTFWKRQNHGNSENNSEFREMGKGRGGEQGRDEQQRTKDLGVNKTTLYDIIMSICNNTQNVQHQE